MRCALLVVCLLSGCGIPDPPGPLIVRPADLARSFRDSPSVADTAYRGQLLSIPCEHCRQDGLRLVWSIGRDVTSPPVVILEFIGPVPAVMAGLWVEGRCEGRTVDNIRRELVGYTFIVRVIECRAVAPQSAPKGP